MLTDWQSLNADATCLRLRLKPFTLGHAFLLAELQSVFVAGGECADPIGELSLAVFVCSQSPDEARRAMSRWWAPRFFRLWAWSCRNLDYQSEAERFAAWLDASTSGPKMWSSGSGREMSSPWWVNLLASLMSRAGVSYADAMGMPVRTARQIICAIGEADGSVDLISEQESAFMDSVRHAEAERRKLGLSAFEYVQKMREEAQRN